MTVKLIEYTLPVMLRSMRMVHYSRAMKENDLANESGK